MTDFTVINAGNITGTDGVDRLIYTYNTDSNDVWLDVTGTLAGYSGRFNGMGDNDCYFTGIENFTFTDLSGGNDVIHTGDGNDVLNGGGGNDDLTGRGGIDVIDGGAGNDLWGGDLSGATEAITIDLNGVSLFLGGGSVANVEAMNLKTGSGNDRITGHATSGMNDTIDTGAGRDVITLAMGGTDTVAGGSGADALVLRYTIATNDVWLIDLTGSLATGYSGNFNGLGSNDVHFSGIERVVFTDVTGGNDTINTGDGDDTLNGGAGDDILNSGGGADKVNGGSGNDSWGASLQSSTEDLTININGVSTFAGTGEVRNVEGLNIQTGSGSDAITGHRTSGLGDTIKTGGGADTIKLFAGGADTVDGGNGNDTLDLTYAVATNDVWLTNLTLAPAGGYAGTFNGLGSNDVAFTGIERFVFTDKSGGNDLIYTGDYGDQIDGGAGNDTLRGMGGADRLTGGAGADTITGGAGNDTLRGGTEADLFVYDRKVNEGRDTIKDFEDGIDHIKIAGGNFAELAVAVVNADDLRITLPSGTVIIVEHMAPADLSAADFNFFISA